MANATQRLLKGRTIVAFDARPFDGAHVGATYTLTCHDPVIQLDNGARLTFTVEETESGDTYGVRVVYRPPARNRKPGPMTDAERMREATRSGARMLGPVERQRCSTHPRRWESYRWTWPVGARPESGDAECVRRCGACRAEGG